MQITFESTVFDPVGVVGLEALPGSDLSASTRRVTRTATLDGQAVIIDNGYTAADSTLPGDGGCLIGSLLNISKKGPAGSL